LQTLPATHDVEPVWLMPPHCPYKATSLEPLAGVVTGDVTVTVTGAEQCEARLERVRVTSVVGLTLIVVVGFVAAVVGSMMGVLVGLMATAVVVAADVVEGFVMTGTTVDLVATGVVEGVTSLLTTDEPDAPSQTAGPGMG
jgi:hypothetical protein